MRGLCLLTVIAWASSGCAPPDGCMGGDDGQCVPRSACEGVGYHCQSPSVALYQVASESDRPPGHAALAAVGDIVLANERFVAVLDAPDSPHCLAPSGGALLDLVPRGSASGDELDQAFQAFGILPDDAARYTRFDLIDESPSLVAVVFRGHLDGRPDMDVVTRYEARPCEPGLRVRTELYHGGRDPLSVLASDAFFWGDKGPLPFVPLRGWGFDHPELDLEELSDALADFPFVAAPSPSTRASSYAAVACGAESLSGFQDRTLSAFGAGPLILMPGDSLALERMLLVAPGPGMQRAVAEATSLRGLLFGEAYVEATGRVVTGAGGPPVGTEVGLLIYEPAPGSDPDAPAQRRPWTEAVPDADGHYAVRVPAGREFRVEAHVHGRPLAQHWAFETERSDLSLPNIVVPATGLLTASVSDAAGQPLVAELVLVPQEPTLSAPTGGAVYGQFRYDRCAPYLGPPHGGTPACNRALVGPSGKVTFASPAGRFRVFATHGPFWTLDEETVEVREGETTSVSLSLTDLALLPTGTVSADLHVHSAASFDSNLPELDRALSFVATGLDVAAATDHDVVTDFEQALGTLGLADRVRVMPGVETTGQILFLEPPGADIPKVIGHFNFWPLAHDRSLPRNGAPDDERLEPGALFERMEPLFVGKGVVQLNHPFGDDDLGRDTGYFTAVGWDPRSKVPTKDDGSAAGQLARRPSGGRSNLSYDAQEVMNGHSFEQFLRYRTAWHSLLGQGIVRAGTANSDSHGLTDEPLGYPRNLVTGDHAVAGFDRERFNEDIRLGRMIGTNGPVVIACVEGADAKCRGPSLAPFAPGSGARVHLEIRAAPWIPVQEIRFVVNGLVVQKIPATALSHPADALGEAGTVRFVGDIPLAQLLVSWKSGDAWLVIEAGLPLRDFECGEGALPETQDTDRDEVLEPGDPRSFVHIVAPGTWPLAFTNPFLLDVDGGGWEAPGLTSCCSRQSCEADGVSP